MSRPKIAFLGAGNVGASCALYCVQKSLGDCVLVDVVEHVGAGKALDMLETTPLLDSDVRVTGSTDFSVIEGARVCVVTAGIARKPGMSRADLLKTNADIVRSCCEHIRRHAPQSIVIMVTNPLDVMALVALKTTGFDKSRVVGMAGVLDSARFSAFIAGELGVSIADIRSMVMGGHGDTMVPLPRFTSVNGIPLPELMDAATIARLADRTRNAGAEVVALLKTGSAYYSPGRAAAQMVESILLDKKQLLPCSAYLSGQYGQDGIFLGVPVVLGAKGVEKIVELELTADEKKLLAKSVEEVRSTLEAMEGVAL
ncbi:MAG TPA: malate dehydrogenase [bacterium]|nr:malate dehydrogenase [bacterium]